MGNNRRHPKRQRERRRERTRAGTGRSTAGAPPIAKNAADGRPASDARSDSTRGKREKRRPERELTETRSIRKETAAGHAEEPPDSENGAEKLYTIVQEYTCHTARTQEKPANSAGPRRKQLVMYKSHRARERKRPARGPGRHVAGTAIRRQKGKTSHVIAKVTNAHEAQQPLQTPIRNVATECASPPNFGTLHQHTIQQTTQATQRLDT